MYFVKGINKTMSSGRTQINTYHEYRRKMTCMRKLLTELLEPKNEKNVDSNLKRVLSVMHSENREYHYKVVIDSINEEMKYSKMETKYDVEITIISGMIYEWLAKKNDTIRRLNRQSKIHI